MSLSDRLAAARRAAAEPEPMPVAAVGQHGDADHDEPEPTWAPTAPFVPTVVPTPIAPPPALPAAHSSIPAAGARASYVDPYAPIKRSVHAALLESLGPSLYDARMDEKELESRVRQTLNTVMDSEETLLSGSDRLRITNEVADEILGYGPLEPYLRDRDVTEIMVNGWNQIYVERSGRLHPVQAAFTDEQHLRRTIDKIVGRIGRRVDEASPMVDARLPDGSRVNAVIAPVAPRRCHAHHPQVRGRPVHGARPHQFRHDDRAHRRPAVGMRAGPDEHPYQRRHRLGQDHQPQRRLVVRARRRADPHHRGRR